MGSNGLIARNLKAPSGEADHSTSKLKICMLLPDEYDPNAPAKPAVREIYGNCFPKMGHKVTWIMPVKAKQKEPQEATFGKVRIRTISRDPDSRSVKKIIAFARFSWKEMKLVSKIIGTENSDIVQARNGMLEGLIGIYLKKKHRIPFVFQYTFPNSRAILEHKLYSSKISYLRAKVEHFIIPIIMRHADLILPISKWMEEELNTSSIAKDKMFPIPMGVNAELFSPDVDGETIRSKYNLSSSKTVVYQGAMEKGRQLEVLIHALVLVKAKDQDIKLLMVGDGNSKIDLEELVQNLGLESNVIFTGRVPYFEIPRFIAAADLAVSPVPPLDIFKVSSPTKLFEAMAMAKPVIANEEIPEHKEVIEESMGGSLVPFTPDGFAEAIIDLLNYSEKSAKIGIMGREWVMCNRNYEKMAREVEKRYYELLETLQR